MRFWRTASKSAYLPAFDRVEDIYRSFSASGRALFLFFAGLLVISSVGLLYLLNESLLVSVPAHGGKVVEGIVGTPRFINPVIAISDADRDLSSLVYSGLLRATPEGDYVPDLASSYDITPDGRTYTFTIKDSATFSDGTPVIADDVAFTIAKTQDSAVKSALRANWDGVVVSVLDTKIIQFTLKSPYAPFIENLTVGILPKHLWDAVSSEEFQFSNLNTSPIGSGPFKISGISRSASGIPTQYDLEPFANYALGEPYLDHMTIKFYQNEEGIVDALKSGDVDAASGISPASLPTLNGYNILQAPLNRVFAVFFNQNQSELLRDKTVRTALDKAVDRQALIQKVLDGYGTPLTTPVPPTLIGAPTTSTTSMQMTADAVASARNMLLAAGWVPGPDGTLSKTTGKGKDAKTQVLAFSLSTGNVPELRAAAEYLREQWGKVGAKVDIKIFDQGDLSQNVIRPRKYDALLFGEIIGRELDLFAFWHSSQRNDPGLNIALYANATADKILEQLRATADDTARRSLYKQFNAELEKDAPAIFLYSPDFVYSVPNDIKGLDLGFIETPSDRFLSVATWHKESDAVWPVFVR